MKALLYSIIALLLFTSATCRKATSTPSLEKALLGEWKYTAKSGGYAGKQEKADPAVTQTLQFKSRHRYLQKINGQVSEQGTYQLLKVKSIYSGKEDQAIRFSGTSSRSDRNNIITVRRDTLIIADNVYDGFKTTYMRVK